jgi:pyrroline-5-carboxylate reductase
MMGALESKRIAFIGAGQMAEALLGGLLAAAPEAAGRLLATDPLPARRDLIKQRFGIRVGSDNLEAVTWAEVVVLAVKPQIFDAVAREIAPAASGRLVLSIAAGVPIRRIAEHLPGTARVVRVMPNAPALVREGVSALAFGPGVTSDDQTLACSLFETVGRVVTVEERLMDAVTGLSGSGPAFVCLAIEALADGGVKAGLPRAVAEQLAAQTVLGAARMVLETGKHPAQLKDLVASPGGTTIAGLHRLEEGGLRACLIAAVEAAAKRSEELGR